MTLVRIEAPHFVAGALLEDGRVVRAAPILRYVVGWDVVRLLEYAERKRWRASLSDDEGEAVDLTRFLGRRRGAIADRGGLPADEGGGP